MNDVKHKQKRRRLTHEMLNAMPLWQLLGVGLRNLRKHERASGCHVLMGEWLNTTDEGVCYACLAGSVLRHEFKMKHFTARELADPNCSWYWVTALDCLRRGQVNNALRMLGRPPTMEFNRPMPGYVLSSHPPSNTNFWRAIRKLKRQLKAAGI